MKMRLFISLVGISMLAACSKQSASTNAPGNNPLNAPADYVAGLNRGQTRAVSVIDTASLDQAIQMFNVNEGRNPKDLNELLASKLIGKIPDAPRGMKLNYDAVAGKVTVVPE